MAVTVPTDPVHVGILMGGASDWPVVQQAARLFDELGIGWEARVMRGRDVEEHAIDYARHAEARGLSVIICAAGSAALLGGTVAQHTILPVLGVPVETGELGGLDALLSTVMMPEGAPVAGLSLGKIGAKNSAYLAAQILALSDPDLRQRLTARRLMMVEAAPEQDAAKPPVQ